MTKKQFWKLNEPKSSWLLRGEDFDWNTRMRSSLRSGVSQKTWPDPPPLFRYERPKRFDDMPGTVHCQSVVSDRFRQLLEAEAPGAAQYLPITLEGPDSDKIGQPYWAVNWLRVFDCLDKKHSVIDVFEGVERIMFACIDPRKIPDDGVLGLLGGYKVVVLFRDDLRKKIKKAGITGFDCGPIAHSVEPPKLGAPSRPTRPRRGV